MAGWKNERLTVVACASGLACLAGLSPAQTLALTDEQTLSANPSPVGALFGIGVATDGGVIAVGASDYSETVLNGGAVFLFEDSGSGWVQSKRLEPAGLLVSDFFGFSVGVSADTLVAGAWGSDTVSNLSGAAYVFERDFGGRDNWGERQLLLAPDAGTGDVFGYSVAIDGDTIAVGAPLDNNSGLLEAGGVYLYQRDAGTGDWLFDRKLVAGDPDTDGQFGFSLALQGDRLVVGSVGSNDQGNGAGAAYVFDRDQGGPGNWGQVVKLLGSDVDVNDQFGQSVAVDGGRVVVGAFKRNRNSVFSGAVFVFEEDFGGVGNWGEAATFRADAPENLQSFGGSVAVSGNAILVGAETTSAGGENDAGSVFVFEEDDGDWVQSFVVEPEAGEGEGDLLGGSMALVADGDGWLGVAGARGDGSVPSELTGSVKVFGIGTDAPCVADLAAPFGVLNFFDISTYISLFNAGEPGADLAAPFGVLNFFDISAYIAAFNAGCP